jgi:hypothetical protein
MLPLRSRPRSLAASPYLERLEGSGETNSPAIKRIVMLRIAELEVILMRVTADPIRQ